MHHLPSHRSLAAAAVDEIIDIVDGPKMLAVEQLAALFAKFSGVLEEYEERRAERMQRMQSEVGARAGWRHGTPRALAAELFVDACLIILRRSPPPCLP